MNQEKIGKFILDLRKKRNLTQKQFGKKFGVTYQAVSKWETGKNIPDIAVIKQICEEFDIDINEVLDIKKEAPKQASLRTNIIVIGIFVVLLVIIYLIQYNYSKGNSFKLKTIEANCDNFNISGSIAYNQDKLSIQVSDVKYCGSKDDTEYKKIECSLYEVENNKSRKLLDCGYEVESKITLDEYLKEIKFNTETNESICKEYADDSLQLELEAYDEEDRITSYKIPLKINDNCKK